MSGIDDMMRSVADRPPAASPTGEPFVLASSSPRRRQLMEAAGDAFTIVVADDSAECGICSRETAPELVARYAYRKAVSVAGKIDDGLIIAADTVASCNGQILGKPHDVDHAAEMLRMLSGRRHDVYTGVALWSRRTSRCVVDVVRVELEMDTITAPMLDDYLRSMKWEGKAGAFGFQDGNDWLHIVCGGSPTAVVGLPMERLSELLENFDSISRKVDHRVND